MNFALKFKQLTVLTSVIVLVAAGLTSASVGAANLSSVQGNVQISRAGGPFLAVSGPTQVNPGDVVRAEAGSSAQVVYADGAVASVGGGGSMIVAADPGAVLAGVAYHGAAAGTGVTTGVSTATIVGGLAVLGGGALLAKKLYDDKKEKAAASP